MCQLLSRAIRAVPKSGEVWCEVGRAYLNPLRTMVTEDVPASKVLSERGEHMMVLADILVEDEVGSDESSVQGEVHFDPVLAEKFLQFAIQVYLHDSFLFPARHLNIHVSTHQLLVV